MSEHDDTLLDEDLGDEEYDLGNDEEEALLADDYEVDRQNSYKGEEETDDVLDLGVTDALDDLEENDEENIEFSKGKTDNRNEHDFYNDGDNQEDKSLYYGQNKGSKYQDGQNRQYEENSAYEGCSSNAIGKGDLREKLQKKNYIGNGQGLEDDDGEEARERRNRFQNERTMISPKMNNEIPDSLENVVTSDSSRSPPFRHRGRGRGMRGGRGIRFPAPNSGNFNPRFTGPRGPSFENQVPFWPPLLENRAPFMMGLPNNVQNQQLPFQQPNPQMPPYQQFPSNPPAQGPPHFVENRPSFNSNQFQELIGPPGPRPAINPRMEFGPRGPIPGPPVGPPYNNPHQPQGPQMQSAAFQNAGGHPPDSQGRLGPMQGPGPGPLLHGNPAGSLLGHPPLAGNPMPILPSNRTHPNQGFPPRQPAPMGSVMQNHPNAPISGQPSFGSRPSFQENIFEGRPYEQRPPFTDQVPNNQFSNNALPPPQQPGSNVPNVPLPPGHKILINPHFRGTVQPTSEGRLAWDMTQQQTPSQPSNNQFVQPSSSHQNPGLYGQTQQSSTDYQQQNYQQNKSDDPYVYFSDVWQENKPQKNQSSPNKQYLADNNYVRGSDYESNNKYKFEGSWERNNYQEEQKGPHQSYRDRDFSSRARNDSFPKTSSSGSYRKESYDQNHFQRTASRTTSSNSRGILKAPTKRSSPAPHETASHDLGPKRMKPSSRNLHEIKKTDPSSNTTEEKIDEDSDPEMLEYRRKMEEQKRLREKILREKENRRKKAALEKQNEELKMETNTASDVHQEVKTSSGLTGVVKDDAVNKNRAAVNRGRGRAVGTLSTEIADRPIGGRVVRTNINLQSNELSTSGKMEEGSVSTGQTNDNRQAKSTINQSTTRRVVIQKSLTTTQKVPTTIHKAILNIQKGQTNAQNRVNTQDSVQKVTQKQAPPILKRNITNVQKVSAQKGPEAIQKTVINVQNVANANAQKIIVNTQNNQRVVLQKSIQAKKVPEIKTNTVKLENLAASTSEAQIRRMCQGIGTLESIHMGEGTATIVFKTQSAAMVFHKKYQRKMLDLSLITVRLIPQPGGNKAVNTLTSG